MSIDITSNSGLTGLVDASYIPPTGAWDLDFRNPTYSGYIALFAGFL
jgi:hypothetical protein